MVYCGKISKHMVGTLQHFWLTDANGQHPSRFGCLNAR